MSESRGKLNRRGFLRLSAVAATGVVAAGCVPAVPTAAPTTAPDASAATAPASEPVAPAGLAGKFTWGTQGKWDEKTEAEWETARLANQLMKKWLEKQPEAQIEQVPIAGALNEWIRTQLTGGTAPDVTFMWRYPDIFRAEWWLDLNPELDKKNPYSTNAMWRDDFRSDILEYGLAEKGELILLAVTLKGGWGQVAWLYNEDMFKKAGAQVPKTWSELLVACKKIKDAGMIPFYQGAGGDSAWMLDWLFSLVFDMLAEKTVLPKLWEHIDPTDKWKPGTPPSAKQMAHALKTGALSVKGEEFKEAFKIVKDFSQYWQSDFLAPPDTASGDWWTQGKVAMRWAGMWDIKPLLNEIQPAFEWGTLLMPSITSETSALGTGAAQRHLGGSEGGSARADLPFMVPKTTLDKPTLPLVLDFMQFCTAPEQIDWFNKNYDPPGYEPGTPIEQIFPDEKKRKAYQAYYTDVEGRNGVQPLSALSNGANKAQIAIMQNYLGDKLSLDQALDQLDQAVAQELDKVIAENPDWNANDWQ